MAVPKPWWVYILQCSDGTLYTGIALDVAARLAQHQAGKGAKYTRGRSPLELVYQEPCGDRAAASRREAAIKRLTRREKWRLVQSMGIPS
jgi:putative endonuclease